MRLVRTLVVLVVCLGCAPAAAAQNWSFDARAIGLGAVGGSENLAGKMVAEQRDYRSIVLPFGLLQVLNDLDRLRPDSDEFDLVRTVEYAAAPLHYMFDRGDDTVTGRDFVVDIGNASLSRDLSDYRGFELENQPIAEGLASPNWGATFRFAGDEDGEFQGIYVGAGPYLSMRTASTIDQAVIDIFASDEPLRRPNDAFILGNATRGQLALAITGGYRARFAAGTSDRDGIYAAFNYNYLRGLRLESVESSLRLDTDSAGLLTINPLLPSPLVLARTNATSGQGFALDFGISAVVNGWEAGFGVNGIANRIDWHDVDRTTYSLGNLFLGDDELVESGPLPIGDLRVELPVDYRINGGRHDDRWSAVAEYGHGFQGDSFRTGVEYRLPAIELRGGAVYTREMWQPTVGLGVNVGPRVGIDFALFGTSANAARERRTGLAVSLRLARF